MNNRDGFTLIELLVVIAILAIVTVMGVTTVLPYMTEAREDAFRIEATEVVKAGDEAVRLYEIGEISLSSDAAASCKLRNSKTYCFSVAELIRLNLYDGESDTFTGRIEINKDNPVNPSYNLYFKKNNEFKIVGGIRESYKDYGLVNDGQDWESSYSECDCSPTT